MHFTHRLGERRAAAALRLEICGDFFSNKTLKLTLIWNMNKLISQMLNYSFKMKALAWANSTILSEESH